MKKVNSDNLEEIITEVDPDKNFIFARLPEKNLMYILKVFGSDDNLTYRFQNIGNVRTKLTSGVNSIESAMKEALNKGCEVMVLEGAWQLAMMLTRYTCDQEDLNEPTEKKEE